MFRKPIVVLIAVFFLVLSLSPVIAAADLHSVTYSITGDSLDLDALELEPEFRLNGIHPAKLNLSFDGDDLYLGADMGLNILKEDNFTMDVHLMLTSDIDGHDFGKGIGLAAGTYHKDFNLFWTTYYFIDDDLDNHAYYDGGINYAIGPRSYLELGVANQYWDLDNDVIKLGIKVKM